MKRMHTSGERARAQRTVDLVQLVAFTVGPGHYALDIMRIKEIIHPIAITPVPKAPAFIEGVVELRGAILPVVDLRRRFDLPATPLSRGSKFIITSIALGALGARGAAGAGDEARRMIVGLVVDGVSEPLRVPRDRLREAPVLATGEVRYFSGVVHHNERILMVLDLDAILSSTEKISLAGMGGPA